MEEEDELACESERWTFHEQKYRFWAKVDDLFGHHKVRA